MNKFLILTASVLALSACAPASDTKTATSTETTANQTASESQNQILDTWFEDTFQKSIQRSPMFMTQLGIKTDNDKWDNDSKEYYLEGLEQTRQELAFLRTNFDVNELDEEHTLSYRLFEAEAERSLGQEAWWDYGYSFSQMRGAQSAIPAFMINYHRMSTIDDARDYVARLNGIKAYLGQHVSNSQASAEKGIMPPAFVYDHVLRDSRNVISGAPFDDGADSTLLADFKKKITGLNLSEEDSAPLIEAASNALIDSVKPAYENLITEMEAQKSQATTDDGAWKLPSGDAYYKARLKLMTSTDMTADEIHDLGLSEVDRIHGEMREIMTSVGFEGSLQDFFTYLKTDPKFTYEDSDSGRDAYLADAAALIETMKTQLDSMFLRKPKADLVVKRVEAFREKSAGKAFYNRPAPDGSRPGTYYANLYRIEDMPTYQMEALAYHEGIPGHHMQRALSQEIEGMPEFRKYLGSTAYTEGWGLYTEYLPKEFGFYSDPYSDFGRLSMEIWRAARLVVDTGLHDKKWTREQAIDYLLTNTPNPEGDAIKAIERYIVMPGQATAYKIGMIKILDLREDAKARLGDKFDIREYHEVVLASGAVPLNILEERVEAWIASKA